MKEFLRKNSDGTFTYVGFCQSSYGDLIEIPEGAEVATIKEDEPMQFWKNNGKYWWSSSNNYWDEMVTMQTHIERHGHKIMWQRPTQPEELPFIDDAKKELKNIKINAKKYGLEKALNKIKELGYFNCQFEKIPSNCYWIIGNSDATVDFASDININVDIFDEYFIDDEPKDNVNNPSHYTNGKVECIDALESATVGKTGIEAVCVANVIKYLWRYEDKNGNEDVKKAKWYLDKLLNVLENK